MRPRAAQSPFLFRSRYSSRIPDASWESTRGVCAPACASASNPSASAAARSPATFFSKTLTRSKARVGEVEALDQDADEGAVELAAAGGGGLLETVHLDARDARAAAGGHRGAALLAV